MTEDIDGVLEPRAAILDAAKVVAETAGVSTRWLSDAVVQMMSPRHDDHPRYLKVGPALAVSVASPEYALAMKAVTSRQSDGDLQDAALLCRQLGITIEAEIEAVIDRYFGTQVHFGAQELFFERIIEAATGA